MDMDERAPEGRTAPGGQDEALAAAMRAEPEKKPQRKWIVVSVLLLLLIAALDTALPAGTYPCTAQFNTYSLEDEKPIGTAAAQITLYVLG